MDSVMDRGLDANQQSAVEEAGATPGKPCASCSAAGESQRYVYALGRIETRFPNTSIEKEFAQSVSRTDSKGLSNQEAFYTAMSQRENRYLARELCWVLRVQGLETYLLHPRDPGDFDTLIEAVRPRTSPMDVDAVIGLRGPIAPPDLCGGLTIPVVMFDQIYSFDADTLVKAIPRPEKMTAEKFEPIAEEVFQTIMQMADNAGETDEHRALNYLAMRYPGIYANAAQQSLKDSALTGVEARTPSLGSISNVVDVILTYTNRKTDFTEKFSVRVAMGKYPSLVNKLTPYYDR